VRSRTKAILIVGAIVWAYVAWADHRDEVRAEKLAGLHRIVDSFTTRRGDSIRVIVMPCARSDGATGHQVEYLKGPSVVDRGCAVLVQRYSKWAIEWDTAPYELQTIHTDYTE
jgi:hypothetical protein